MASESSTAKAESTPKAEPAAKDKGAAGETPAKAGSGEAAAPKNYSRGEGQKPVTDTYRQNWNAIFAKKKSKRKSR